MSAGKRTFRARTFQGRTFVPATLNGVVEPNTVFGASVEFATSRKRLLGAVRYRGIDAKRYREIGRERAP